MQRENLYQIPEISRVHPTTATCMHFEIDGDRAVRFCPGLIWVVRFPRTGADHRYATWCDSCNEVRDFADNDADPCPSCGDDMRGPEIPKARWHEFGARRYSYKISVYDTGLHRITHYRCPRCKHEWR